MLPQFRGVMIFVLAGWVVVVAGPGALANAADGSENDLIRQGVEARKRSDDAGAFQLFKQAYSFHHSPRAAAQMGMAELALGRWVEAEAHLAESLRAKDDSWIKKNAKAIAETLERVRGEIGTLDVLGMPRGAEIVIAGEVRATLPLESPISVRAGEVQFQLRAVGYLSETRTVHVKARELTRESVSLSPIPPAAVAPTAVSSARAGGPADLPPLMKVPSGSEERPNIRAQPASSNGRVARIAGIVAAGLGVAAVGTGLAFGLKARAAGIDQSNAPTYDPNASSIGRRYERVQWIGYGAGAALVTGGVIAYLIGATRRTTNTTEIGFAPSPAGGVASLRGAF
ncbi:MAG TPA: hypothetical protein VFH68_06210 [Polyangia bacterium]|nr:hypothetical protein [Polyangia bacterium]